MFLEVPTLSFEVRDLVAKPHGLWLCAGPSLYYYRLTRVASRPFLRVTPLSHSPRCFVSPQTTKSSFQTLE
jgi:hypothetical protein